MLTRGSHKWFLRLVLVATLLWLLPVIGCGGGEEESAVGPGIKRPDAGKNRKDSKGGVSTTKAAPDKLTEVKMPEVMPAELFYEGDGAFDVDGFYDADTGKVTYSLVKGVSDNRRTRVPGSGTPIKEKVYAGVYTSDRIQGPYKLVGRFLGQPTEVGSEMALDDVRLMYCRVVTYSEDGTAETVTNPARIVIRPLAERKPAAPSRSSTKTKKDAKKQDNQEEKTEAAQEQKKIKVVVVAFLDESSARPSTYLEQGLRECLSRALATCEDLDVSRPDLVRFAIEQRRIGERNVLKTEGLKNLVRVVDAEKLVFGTFKIEGEKIALTGTISDTATEAQYTAANLNKGLEEGGALAGELLDKLSENLGTKISEEARTGFKDAVKGLLGQVVKVGQIRQKIADLDFKGAVAIYEQLGAEGVKDADVLTSMAQAYREVGQYERAAELEIAAIRISGGIKRVEDTSRLRDVLRNVADLKKALDLLGTVELPGRVSSWEVGHDLVKRAAGKAETVPANTKNAPRRTWPLVPPQLKIESDRLLLNPTRVGDLVVVFSSDNVDTMKLYEDMNRRAGQGGIANMQIMTAERFTTSAYGTDGQVKWEVKGLMTPTVKPVLDGGTMYGVRDGALVSVDASAGTVKWESKVKPLTLPERKQGIQFTLVRPWWRTWEVRTLGAYVLAWDPDGAELHTFKKADGSYVGVARYQRLGGLQERMFLESKGKLYYQERGQGTLKELTEADLADPGKLQSRLRLGANNECMLEDGTVYELRRRMSGMKASAGAKLFYGVAVDAGTGALSWTQMMMNECPPVITQGKMFRLKPAEAGKISSVVEAIDPKARETKTINLTSLGLDDVTPTGRLLKGKAILLGGQVALSVPEYQVMWVNTKLPTSERPVEMADNLILLGSLLVQEDSGAILGEMEAGETFDWNGGSVAVEQGEVLCCSSQISVKGLAAEAKSVLVTFKPEVSQLAALKDMRTATTKREPMSPEKIEEAVWASRVVPETGPNRWELHELLARWRFQASSEPKDAIDYLVERAGQQARTIDGRFELLKLTHPYASLAGTMGTYVETLEALEKEYPKSAISDDLKKELTGAKEEIAQREKAVKLIEELRAAKDDGTRTYGSARGTSSMIGSTGSGVKPAPILKQKWSKRMGSNGSVDSLIMPVGDMVVVLVDMPGTLRVLKAENGDPVWDAGKSLGVACYRGIVYVLGDALEARDLTSGTVLWQAVPPSEVDRRCCAVAAGMDLCVISTGDVVAAYEWDTGKRIWKQDLTDCDRLEMHAGYVAAGSRGEQRMTLLQKTDGKPVWTRDAAAYALYDGFLYTLKHGRRAEDVAEVKLERWGLLSTRMDGSATLSVPLKGSLRRMPSPLVSEGMLLVTYGPVLISLTLDGKENWRSDLGQNALTDMTASPTTLYVGLENSDLCGYDLGQSGGPEVMKLPLTGGSPTAMSKGVMYALKRGELLALEGEASDYSEAYLKKLENPAQHDVKVATEPVGTIAGASRVTVGRGEFARNENFQSVGALAGALGTDLTSAAFEVLLDSAGYDVLKGPAEKYFTSQPRTREEWAAMDRTKQPLGSEEGGALADELVQRGISEAVGMLVEGVAGRFQASPASVAEALRYGDPNVYGAALLALCRQSTKEADWRLGVEAIKLFGYWQYQPAIGFLAEEIENDQVSMPVRLECVNALGRFEDGRTTTQLSKVMGSKDLDFKLVKAAAEMLANGGDQGVRSLGYVLNNSAASLEARKLAADSLGKAASPQALQTLQKMVTNSSLPEELRAQCVYALGVSGQEAAVDMITKFMKVTSLPGQVQNACLHGLAATKRRDVVPLLIDAIGGAADNRQFQRDSVSQLLRGLTGMDFGPAKDKWRQWYELQKDKPWRSGL